MIFNATLSWNLYFQIFTCCFVAQSVMVTGSNFNSLSTMTDVDNTQMNAIGRSTHICTEGCMSVGYPITTSNDATTRQLNPITQIVQTSFKVVGDVTDDNVHSSATETLVLFDDVYQTTATNKMETVSTQAAKDNSLNDAKRFSGNDSVITRVHDLPDTVTYTINRDVNLLLGNDSLEVDPQANATHSAMFEALGNTSIPLVVQEEYWQDRLKKTLFVHLPPVMIIVGTIGNAASVITFQHRHFRHTSTGFILTALSVVDIVHLDVHFLSYWLMVAFGIRAQEQSRISCKIVMVAAYYPQQLASWTLILLTAERSISVWYPLRCKELCSRRRIIVVWIIIALILLAENIFLFLAFDLLPSTSLFGDWVPNQTKVEVACKPIDDYWFGLFFRLWPIMDAVVGDFVPFVLILIGNILTISRLIKSHWERKTQMGAALTSKPMASTTAMLIGISAMFLLLNLPNDSIFLYNATTDLSSIPREKQADVDLTYSIGTLCFNANHAFEFIVYFVSGQRFREAFLETFLPCRKTTSQRAKWTTERSRTESRAT